MAETTQKPILYLDVNVILDAMDNRRPAAANLLSRIEHEQIETITSPFSILEMLEAKKADKWALSLLDQGLSFFQVQRRLRTMRTGPSRLKKQSLDQVYRDLQEKLQRVYRLITFPAPTSSLMN